MGHAGWRAARDSLGREQMAECLNGRHELMAALAAVFRFQIAASITRGNWTAGAISGDFDPGALD